MTPFFVVLAVLAVIVLLGGLFLLATANRLDRLHVRTDAGWAALDAALGRRAVVARAAAAVPGTGTGGGAADGTVDEDLLAVAARAEAAGRAEREAEENELTRLLGRIDRAALPPALREDLVDAERRVVIARRMHNDAVRDTRALRRRRKVRYFRLAGTAPLPEYFEIVEPET